MFPRSAPLLLTCLLLATLPACGDDDPLGRKAAATTPVPVSDATTTAQLTKAAIDHALPSVVAISVTRNGVTRNGTGTVVQRGLVIADAALIGTPASQLVASAERSPAPQHTPAVTGTATPAVTAAAANATAPAATSPTTPGAAATTTPAATATTPTATPTTRPSPVPPIPATVIVREGSGEEHEATIEGTDRVSGLSLLRVGDLDAVAPARAGSTPKLGQELASVGYLSARREAVRPGTVVTTGRAARENRENEVGLIEATAPLGPQGIGGPLVDGRGQVVAVTTRAVMPVVPGAVLGVPYSSVLRIARALAEGGRVRRAYLGLDTIAITPTRAEALDLQTASGVLVQSLVPGSPAAFSSLKGPTGRRWIAGRLVPTGSDAITQIDGIKLREPEELEAVLATKRPGSRIALRVIRGNRSLTVHITLGER
ncbi:MAG: S1C family serine protease [Patulibacter sp.]